MRTFEEKFTAWVDGCLAGEELAAFEKELEAHPEALEERQSALQLGHFLRQHLEPKPLANADFFNLHLLQQIEAEQTPALRARAHRSLWTLPRMALSGAFFLMLATVLYFAAVPSSQRQIRRNREYVANILSSHTDVPGVTATAFHSKEDNVTVLWLDGLQYMPENHKLK